MTSLNERVMAALLSPSMSPETLSDKERQEVIANMKAEPYNGPFSIVEVGAWLGCSMEEAQALWDGVEAHGNPLGIIEMAKERGYAPPLEEPQARIVSPGPFTCLYDVTGNNLPEQDPELICRILRKRQVMLIAAPSKAGKACLAVSLMWALSTGGEWLGARCARMRVVYCNMEVSPASFAVRCETVRREAGIPHDAARMVDVLSGRGAAYDAEGLVEAIMGHLGGAGACVIVDCHAIETGSENDAEAVRTLFAELDRLTRAGCSVVGIHHFPKGSSGMKASIDRMAGSSVFARSPDALLSLDPLDVDDEGEEGRELAEARGSGYRLSFDLRDFKARRPIDLIFTGTRFLPDTSGRLSGSHIKGSPQAGRAGGGRMNAKRRADERERKSELILDAMEACDNDGVPTSRENVLERYNDKASAYGLDKVSMTTFRDWTKPSGQYPFHMEGGIMRAD